jgi:RAQPRD family integrative conjugative element protein
VIPSCLSMSRAVVALGAGVFGVVLIGQAMAHDEIQRRDLAVIQQQLEQIHVVVDRLEARQANHTPQTTSVYLDIRQLRADLDRISEGIDLFLEPVRLPPREPLPLDGDYLRRTR